MCVCVRAVWRIVYNYHIVHQRVLNCITNQHMFFFSVFVGFFMYSVYI